MILSLWMGQYLRVFLSVIRFTHKSFHLLIHKSSTGSHTSHNSIHSCEQLYRTNGHPTASAGRLALSPSVSVSDDNNIIRQADGDSSLLHTHRVLLNN